MRIIFAFVTLAFVLASCSKDDPWDGKEYDPRIIGKWESIIERPYSYFHYIFREDMTTEIISGDTYGVDYNDKGTYSMDKKYIYIIFEDGSSSKASYEVNDSTLNLSEIIYKRIKEV